MGLDTFSGGSPIAQNEHNSKRDQLCLLNNQYQDNAKYKLLIFYEGGTNIWKY
jgi:hypothetical protein